MFTGFFGWLRRKAKLSIIQGVQDALDDLAGASPDEAPAEPLRLTFQAPEAEAAPAERKKRAGAG